MRECRFFGRRVCVLRGEHESYECVRADSSRREKECVPVAFCISWIMYGWLLFLHDTHSIHPKRHQALGWMRSTAHTFFLVVCLVSFYAPFFAIQPVLSFRFSRVRVVDVVDVRDRLIDLLLYSSSAVRPLSPRDLAQADSRRLTALRLVAH